MNFLDKTDIGKTYEQDSGYLSTIIGSFIDDKETIFVAKTNRPETRYWLYWNNGNSYSGSKECDTQNHCIRKYKGEIK